MGNLLKSFNEEHYRITYGTVGKEIGIVPKNANVFTCSPYIHTDKWKNPQYEQTKNKVLEVIEHLIDNLWNDLDKKVKESGLSSLLDLDDDYVAVNVFIHGDYFAEITFTFSSVSEPFRAEPFRVYYENNT